MSDSSSNDDILKFVLLIAASFLSAFFLGALIVLGLTLKWPHLFSKRKRFKDTILSLIFFVLSVFIYFILSYYKLPQILKLLASISLFSAGFALITTPFWRVFITKNRIQVKDLITGRKFRHQNINNGHPGKALIGTSMKSFSPVSLTQKERVMHTLISGSTGSGKTTTLKSLFIDAALKDHPILIIDPKGNSETIEEFRQIAIKYGKNPNKFKVFSIINPETSCHYNPLKRGSAVQIKDRLMSSLEWSEQFYKNQSSSWLGSIIEILDAINYPITINTLCELLTNLKFADLIDEKIKAIPDRNQAKLLQTKFRNTIKKTDKNQDNLLSQLRDLNNLEFGPLLTPSPNQPEIDLAEVIKNNEIAYFQLNTMAYELTAKTLGRLILNDLKALASQIHGGKADIKPKFFPIFVDEFGSFCSQSFIELLKMCRDVDFALHLFFQSLADLDTVSPEFKSQVQQNCLTKLILRIDDPDEVDFWAGVAGTIDTIETSYKTVNLGKLNLKTGEGNTKFTKNHRVEHDVFKQLQIGEAIMIQKSPSREDLISLWNPT